MESSHDEGMFKCKFWNEDFVQEIHLKRQNPFECMVCMKKFALERDKKKHMREEHEERQSHITLVQKSQPTMPCTAWV